MPKEHWDCWDTDTPAPTSQPTTSQPPSSGPEPEEICYPPRIEDLIIGPMCEINIMITRG